jgi:hypothetical protein
MNGGSTLEFKQAMQILIFGYAMQDKEMLSSGTVRVVELANMD